MNKIPSPRRRGRSSPAVVPNGTAVAEFEQYLEAIQYVDKLVGANFPTGMVAIVGSDLKTVERVRGKLSYAKVALNGAVAGSWMGLIFGILFSGSGSTAAMTAAVDFTAVGSSIFIGAGAIMLINVIRFSLTSNKRQFVSNSRVVASRYEVIVPNELADQARAAASSEPAPN